MSRHALIERIRTEYLEMPGLRLTTRQASRLWGADAAQCQAAFDALVQIGFLWARHDGAYLRAVDSRFPRPVAAKAELPSAPLPASAS